MDHHIPFAAGRAPSPLELQLRCVGREQIAVAHDRAVLAFG
jgi:hypothetical protein